MDVLWSKLGKSDEESGKWEKGEETRLTLTAEPNRARAESFASFIALVRFDRPGLVFISSGLRSPAKGALPLARLYVI